MERRDVKITVLRAIETGDILKNYGREDVTATCQRVKVSQQFISKDMQMPEGFCSWAWADIQRDVIHLALGGHFPWIKDKGTSISCCTDGLRPVVFKLECL